MGYCCLANNAALDEPCRIPRMDFVVGNQTGDDATSTCDRAFPQCRPGKQNALCASPRSVHQSNRRDLQTERRIAPIVVAGAEIGSLRDANAAPQTYGGEVVDPTALPDPAIARHLEVPWILDRHA